jgi:hypothetical protein
MFYVEFRFECYIKIKPTQTKIIYLLYIFLNLILQYLKVFKFHLFFAGLYKLKNFKNNYRVAMTTAQRKYIQRSHFRLISRKGFFQSAMFLASALKRGSHPPENILKI